MSRILVVDDNPMNLRLTCIALEMAGHETVSANNGLAAVEIAQSQPFDLILMDLRMPIMDGKNAMKIIRARPATNPTPVIALTASAMKGEREELLACGFNGYIDKPIDVNTFASTIAAYLPIPGESTS